MVVSSLRRSPLHEEVTDALREMIVAGDLKSGVKISEQSLCARLEISRTPLREALKVLAAEGLVQLLPRRGAVVAQISETEIDELFPIMGVLEGLAGELACMNLTDQALAKVRRLHAQLVGFYRKSDELNYLKVNREIHRALFTAANNPSLTALYEQLLVRTHAVRFTIRKTAAQWEKAVNDHELIMQYLEKRDARKLSKILRSHMTETAASIARTALIASEAGARA